MLFIQRFYTLYENYFFNYLVNRLNNINVKWVYQWTVQHRMKPKLGYEFGYIIVINSHQVKQICVLNISDYSNKPTFN
jgi:hypothetical protein